MTFQHDADGVPLEGTQSDFGAGSTEHENQNGNQSDSAPGHSRTLLAVIAAGTLAIAPIASTVLGPAGGGDGAHSSPVFLLAEVSHDVGHNDWAFQGGLDDRIIWIITYVALAIGWLGVALWMRAIDRRAARTAEPNQNQNQPTTRRWLRVLGAALGAEFAAGALTIGAGLYAQWTATNLGPVALRLADVCSPWWSCVAVLIVVARAERSTIALRAAFAYGAVLALVLLVPFPGPSDVKALILAATAAAPALLPLGLTRAQITRTAPVRPDAAATG